MKPNKDIEEQLRREEEFHDQWASSENLDDIQVEALFESMLAMENSYMLQHMGDLRGKRILDVGAGLGESSVYFAMQGAEVVYNDISPEMGRAAEKLAQRYGVTLEYAIAPVERLSLDNEQFDIVYCANLMHHVPPQDHDHWLESMQRSLKPGGWLYTWDPLKYNPVINIYRSMATEVRTDDEMPLSFSILKTYKKHFAKVEHREFWLGTLWIFLHYFLIRRYNPNEIRYWKQIYKEDEKQIGWWFKTLRSLDNFLLKIPGLRAMAWNTVIMAQK